MKVELFSEKGKRDNNQDYILSKKIDECSSLHIVADGMGGYENGRIAAEIAAQTIFDYLSQTTHLDSDEAIVTAVQIANEKIKKFSLKEKTKMGTTIGGAYFVDNMVKYFWVGDVRINHISNAVQVFESEDHSFVNELKAKGLASNNVEIKRLRHIVTRSIQGSNDKYQPQIHSLEFAPNDRILICSDGFLEAVGTNEIKDIGCTLELSINKLQERCKSCKDNASLIVIHT